MTFLSKFKHCFYEMSRELLDLEVKPTRVGLSQLIDLLAFVITFRMLFIMYVLFIDFKVPPWYDFKTYDVIVSYAYTYSTTFDYTTISICYFFVLMYFLLKLWCFRLDVRGCHWRFWYQLTVGTFKQYFRCRLEGQKLKQIYHFKKVKYEEKIGGFFLYGGKLPFVGLIARTFAWIEIAYRMEDVDVVRLASKPLPSMPFLAWEVRAKALRVMLATEYFTYAFQVFIVIVYGIAMAVLAYIYPGWSGHHWLAIVDVICEMTYPLIFILFLVRYLVLFTTMTVLGTLVFTSHLLGFQKQLMAILKAHKRLKFIPPVCNNLFERFLRQHNVIVANVVSCSGQLWGKIVLATVCTQIPINIIFVRKIAFSGEETPLTLKLVLFLIFAVQLALFGLIFAPLSWCQKVYHSPKKFIPQFLLLTTGSPWRRLRFKYNDLYGRLLRGPKFAISIGPLHAITYFSSLELLFTYLAYLLVAFSQDSI